jgi:outer membrane protein OmpA-like peptidoglycan-associated protein
MAARCRGSYWFGLLLGLASCTTSRSTPPQIVSPATNKVENNKCACEKIQSPAHPDHDSARGAESEIHAGIEARPDVRQGQPRPAKKAPVPAPALAKQATQTRQAPDENQQPGNPGTGQVDLTAAQLLDSIYFSQNGATLEGAIAQLEAVASFAAQPDGKGLLLITGHADSAEAAPYELGLQRASAVHDFLVQHGVPRPRIKIQSLGDSQSSTPKTAQPGRNRRVEIRSLGR